MKKTLIALTIALTLTACTKEAQSVSHEGIEFEVELLFEKDGVKMYRFYDNGRYHYYTNQGETSTTQSEGKYSTYEENIK
jgi:hypothetical protein